MLNKVAHFTGLISCIAIIGACFLPWTYYESIQQTFTGYDVKTFPGGNYYGKAGIPITVLASLIIIMMLIPKVWARRTNLFLAGILVAYTIRTYIIFTGSLFKGEVKIFPGMYLIILLSLIIMITTLFPKLSNSSNKSAAATPNS